MSCQQTSIGTLVNNNLHGNEYLGKVPVKQGLFKAKTFLMYGKG